MDKKKHRPQKKDFDKAMGISKWLNIATLTFYGLSIFFNFIDKSNFLTILNIVFIFILESLRYFIDYYQNRAENTRRKDFFDNSFGSKLSEQNSEDYYDNEESEKGLYKMTLNLFENSFFSKEISERMKINSIKRTIIYATILTPFIVKGFIEDNVALVILQLFISSTFILETLKISTFNRNVEIVYNSLKQYLENSDEIKTNTLDYKVVIINILLEYETNISANRIFLSDKLYKKLNPKLTEDWKNLKKRYNL